MKDNFESEQHVRHKEELKRMTDSKGMMSSLPSLMMQSNTGCHLLTVTVTEYSIFERKLNKKGQRQSYNLTVSSFLTHMIHVPN